MTSYWSSRSQTEGTKKLTEPHRQAIDHFRYHLPRDFKRYAYAPPEGYRVRRYDNPKAGTVPKFGERISMKGEWVTAIAKDAGATIGWKVVNVLFVSHGRDPDTKSPPRFFWWKWDEPKHAEYHRNKAKKEAS